MKMTTDDGDAEDSQQWAGTWLLKNIHGRMLRRIPGIPMERRIHRT